jgi:cytochrome c-type biogenesis protein CcmH
MAVLLLGLSLAAFGQAEEVANPDPAVERRLRELAEELRCLVCQNQTIADSNAPLALDLRNQLRQQIKAGRSDEQIRSYMVERYGDFVLYRPPFRARTALLWAGPFLLVAFGVAIFVFMVRRRRPEDVPASIDPAKRSEIEALLDGREATQSPIAPAGRAGTKKKGGRSGRP